MFEWTSHVDAFNGPSHYQKHTLMPKSNNTALWQQTSILG